MQAADVGDKACLQVLLDAGANYKLKDAVGRTALDYAIKNNRTEIIKILMDLPEYDDVMLKIDNVISDGGILDLGNMCIKVIETPGHTKCSLSFLINNETLFACESTGYMSKSGKNYPAFLTSCFEAINSIHICQEINPRFIISPHYGLVNETDTLDYWRKCILAVKETQEFIIYLSERGYNEKQILTKYDEKFRDDQSRLEQPINAFRLNAQSMIKTVFREKYGSGAISLPHI